MLIAYIKPIFQKALALTNVQSNVPLIFESPKNSENGDLSTNIAMRLAKELKQQPRSIAEHLISLLEYDNELISKVEIAGTGFINIYFTEKFFINALNTIIQSGDQYGRSKAGKGLKVNVEYVSVNPTGLLHLGHGRNAVIGDTVANLFEWTGHEVTREYYFNNAGNQMNNLAKSIYARYRQIMGDQDYPFPEDGYHGEYIKEIAQELYEINADSLSDENEDNLIQCRKFGENWCFGKIKATLERMKIHQEVYYNEDSLYSSGKIESVINDLRSRGWVYEKDGALWLALSQFGLKDDRVIVKSSGEPTYRLPDIAYHREKFLRGFDILVDVFGADHIATVPDVLAAIAALGFDKDKVKVLIHQFVTLTENGEQVKMSKRTGKSYTLDELLDEVGADVVRFFLLMRGISTHLEFDLSLAREQSDKNPVFYLQYAHARISSVFDTARERGINYETNPDISILSHITEFNLIKSIIQFPKIISLAKDKCEPMILADYLRSLAADFHFFYHECRIIGSESALMHARLQLALTTKIVIKNGLTILGISAPERM
ncbi:MAG: arginine--tRNA ligase [Candidatus Kapabacteria bacterium]|nr:arginine--tRNA ligase [Candidatus Kapabacteria bacterium]